MDTGRTISISEARKRIFDIADEVQTPHQVYTLTADGKPKAVIMSARDFDALAEDIELLSDPLLFKRVQQSEQEFKQGAYVTLAQLKRELGYITNASLVAEKGRRTYRARKRPMTKRRV